MTDISISKTQYSSNVLYGEFDDARIPSLDTSKITSGTLPSTRLVNIETGNCIHWRSKIMIQVNYNYNRVGFLIIKEKNDTDLTYLFGFIVTHTSVQTTLVYTAYKSFITLVGYGYNDDGGFGPIFEVSGYSSSKDYKFVIFWSDNT